MKQKWGPIAKFILAVERDYQADEGTFKPFRQLYNIAIADLQLLKVTLNLMELAKTWGATLGEKRPLQKLIEKLTKHRNAVTGT